MISIFALNFRGHGWRGLVALGLWLIVRGAVFVVAIFASKPTAAYLIGLWHWSPCQDADST
jgi:hypothetical protein